MVSNSGADLIIKVGMAQFRVAMAPVKMMTMALGSCVGIVLYDPKLRLGGLAHVMHPNRDKVKNNTNRAKFVDSAIELMFSMLLKKGARKGRLEAKIFGGAKMFGHISQRLGVTQIGDKNVEAAREHLLRRKIPIVAECVGGSTGRTIMFDLSDGTVKVKSSHGGEESF